MRIPRLRRWRPRAEIAMWRRGWAWAIGAVLGLAAGGAYLVLLQPLQQARQSALLELTEARRELANGPPLSHAGQTLDDGARVLAVQTLLQRSPEAGQIVRQMVALARAEQITLVQADYQQQVNARIGVTRVQITQPVRATYPQLRRYIEAVLAATPNASLDQVVAKRENVAQTQVEARLKWSLWISRPGATSAVGVVRRETSP